MIKSKNLKTFHLKKLAKQNDIQNKIEMLNYKDYEKKVYDWLIDKNRQDPAFILLKAKGFQRRGNRLFYWH